MKSLLLGCWSIERASITDAYYSICFSDGGGYWTSYFGAAEGLEGEGSFVVRDSKLHINQENVPALLFDTESVSCDVVVRPKYALKLYNCLGTGEGGDVVRSRDVSFAFATPR